MRRVNIVMILCADVKPIRVSYCEPSLRKQVVCVMAYITTNQKNYNKKK